MASQEHPEKGPKKPRGRPKLREVVKIKGDVPPELKAEAIRVARGDKRLKSETAIVEAAIGFYLKCYELAGGRLDNNNFPEIPDFKVRPDIAGKSRYEHAPAKAGPRKEAATHRLRPSG